MAIADTDLAWLAGIIDGEGSLSLRVGRRRYTPRLALGNTSKSMMDTVSKMFSLLGVRWHESIQDRKRRPVKVVVLQGDQAVVVVKAVRPFLRAKAEQADVLLEYSDWRIGYPRNLGGRKAFDDAFQATREHFHTRITAPKHRKEYGEVSWPLPTSQH